MNSGLLFLSILALIILGSLLRIARRNARELRQQLSSLRSQYSVLQESSTHLIRKAWFQSLRLLECHNEIEVEAKFVAPLVCHLGYNTGDFELRVPVQVQIGTQIANGVADWVLRQARPSLPFYEATRIVIETKSFEIGLSQEAQAQARSYALALEARFYILTNGKRLQLYRVRIPQDEVLLDIPVRELEHSWNILRGEVGQVT